MTQNIIIVLLSILLVVAEYANTSQAQDTGTIPACATATRRPTRTPEGTPTATPTPTIIGPAYLGYNWLVPVGGQP